MLCFCLFNQIVWPSVGLELCDSNQSISMATDPLNPQPASNLKAQILTLCPRIVMRNVSFRDGMRPVSISVKPVVLDTEETEVEFTKIQIYILFYCPTKSFSHSSGFLSLS